MKKRGFLLFLCITIMLFCADVYAMGPDTWEKDNQIPDELSNLYAQSAVLMDADSGRILFGKKEHNRMPMASTTKIMTCILVLENVEIDEMAMASEYAASQPKVKLGVKAGNSYLVEDLLFSLMLESHNDSAVVLAEYVSGSVEKFAELMNKKAKELGCLDTHFVTPNGLDAADDGGMHSTTASDLARIMRYCVCSSDKREEFLRITQTNEHIFQADNRQYHCYNHNALLHQMDGVLSGKTGFTAKAGYCYVGAAKQEEETYILALLACGWPNNKHYKWSDAKKLFQYGMDNYSYQNVWKNVRLKDVVVEDAMTDNWESVVKTPVGVEDEMKELCLLVKNDEEVKIDIDMKERVNAPIDKNSKAGEIKYYISSEEMAKYNIVFLQNVDKKTWKNSLVKITKKLLILS